TAPVATPIVTVKEPVIRAPANNKQASSDSSEMWTDEASAGAAGTPRCPPSPNTSVNTPAAPFLERVGVADAEPAAFNGCDRTKLQSILQRHIMAELGFVDPIDPDRPLNEVGLDSLRSVTLANSLEDDFGHTGLVRETHQGTDYQ